MGAQSLKNVEPSDLWDLQVQQDQVLQAVTFALFF